MQHATATNTIINIFIVTIMTILSLVGSYGISNVPVRPNPRHSVNPLPFSSFWSKKLDYMPLWSVLVIESLTGL